MNNVVLVLLDMSPKGDEVRSALVEAQWQKHMPELADNIITVRATDTRKITESVVEHGAQKTCVVATTNFIPQSRVVEDTARFVRDTDVSGAVWVDDVNGKDTVPATYLRRVHGECIILKYREGETTLDIDTSIALTFFSICNNYEYIRRAFKIPKTVSDFSGAVSVLWDEFKMSPSFINAGDVSVIEPGATISSIGSDFALVTEDDDDVIINKILSDFVIEDPHSKIL